MENIKHTFCVVIFAKKTSIFLRLFTALIHVVANISYKDHCVLKWWSLLTMGRVDSYNKLAIQNVNLSYAHCISFCLTRIRKGLTVLFLIELHKIWLLFVLLLQIFYLYKDFNCPQELWTTFPDATKFSMQQGNKCCLLTFLDTFL